MAGITEAMSKMGGGGRRGGISEHMERPEHEREPEGEHDGVHGLLKNLHEKMGGKHMHTHQHEDGYTTHHVKEDGKVEGPHEHRDLEEVKNHMDGVFEDGEQHEPPSEHDGLI